MRKSTIEFIKELLERELEAEYIQDNANNNEIEYVKDLMLAYKDFLNSYGTWIDVFTLQEYKKKLNLK